MLSYNVRLASSQQHLEGYHGEETRVSVPRSALEPLIDIKIIIGNTVNKEKGEQLRREYRGGTTLRCGYK